jgi:hypothetical protein
MELIERYLQAVKFWLPRQQKHDIIAELSEDIYSQVEEKESELGRKLNDLEVEMILKQRGRPVLVANRYQPQQYLIGPVLFPIYTFVLKVIAVGYLLPWVLIWMGIIRFSPTYRAAHGGWLGSAGSAWAGLWTLAFTVIGLATIIFVVLEQVQAKNHFMEKWDPRKLPPARNPNQIKRFNSIFEIVFLTIFGVGWWLTYFSSLQILNYPGIRVTLTSMWWVFWWGFLASNLANLAISCMNFARPYWTLQRATLKFLVDASGAGLFCWLMKSNIVAEIWVRNMPAERLTEITNMINSGMARVWFYVLLVNAVIVAVDLYRIYRVHQGVKARPLENMVAALL